MVNQLTGGNRPLLILLAISFALTTMYIVRQSDGDRGSIIDYRILDEKDTTNFLSKYALYDNRDGKMAPYKLSNPNATDYSETGDKSTRILKLLNGLVRKHTEY